MLIQNKGHLKGLMTFKLDELLLTCEKERNTKKFIDLKNLSTCINFIGINTSTTNKKKIFINFTSFFNHQINNREIILSKEKFIINHYSLGNSYRINCRLLSSK